VSDNVQKLVQILSNRSLLDYFSSYKEAMSIEDFSSILEEVVVESVEEGRLTEEQMDRVIKFLGDKKLVRELHNVESAVQVRLNTKLLAFLIGGK